MNTLPKILLFMLLLYWSYFLISSPTPWIFIDGVNLLFHEAGHVLFMLLGQFMQVLGGSLLQCLIPFGIMLYFLKSRQHLAAAFSLFWLGNNFINVSVYIKDARTRILPLLGGDISGHDWHWLLESINLLDYDQIIGNVVWSFGLVCIFTALAWILYSILKEILTGHIESIV